MRPVARTVPVAVPPTLSKIAPPGSIVAFVAVPVAATEDVVPDALEPTEITPLTNRSPPMPTVADTLWPPMTVASAKLYKKAPLTIPPDAVPPDRIVCDPFTTVLVAVAPEDTVCIPPDTTVTPTASPFADTVCVAPLLITPRLSVPPSNTSDPWTPVLITEPPPSTSNVPPCNTSRKLLVWPKEIVSVDPEETAAEDIREPVSVFTWRDTSEGLVQQGCCLPADLPNHLPERLLNVPTPAPKLHTTVAGTCLTSFAPPRGYQGQALARRYLSVAQSAEYRRRVVEEGTGDADMLEIVPLGGDEMAVLSLEDGRARERQQDRRVRRDHELAALRGRVRDQHHQREHPARRERRFRFV